MFIERQLVIQVVAGNRAGAITVLLDTLNLYANGEKLQGELKPTHIVKSLSDIAGLMQEQYDLQRPLQITRDA